MCLNVCVGACKRAVVAVVVTMMMMMSSNSIVELGLISIELWVGVRHHVITVFLLSIDKYGKAAAAAAAAAAAITANSNKSFRNNKISLLNERQII